MFSIAGFLLYCPDREPRAGEVDWLEDAAGRFAGEAGFYGDDAEALARQMNATPAVLSDQTPETHAFWAKSWARALASAGLAEFVQGVADRLRGHEEEAERRLRLAVSSLLAAATWAAVAGSYGLAEVEDVTPEDVKGKVLRIRRTMGRAWEGARVMAARVDREMGEDPLAAVYAMRRARVLLHVAMGVMPC